MPARRDSLADMGYYRCAVALDPMENTARRRLMEALAQGGSIHEVFAAHRSVADLLKREMKPTVHLNGGFGGLERGTHVPDGFEGSCACRESTEYVQIIYV